MIDSQEIVKKYTGKVSLTLYSAFPSVDCLSSIIQHQNQDTDTRPYLECTGYAHLCM